MRADSQSKSNRFDRFDYHKFENSFGRPQNQPAKKKFTIITAFKIMAVLLVAAIVIGGLHQTNECQPTVRCTDN